MENFEGDLVYGNLPVSSGSTSSLKDFYNYTGDSQFNQGYLDVLRQYDPNAVFSSNQGAGEGVRFDGGGQYVYDESLLPKNKLGVPLYMLSPYNDANQQYMKDPNAWVDDPVYGKITLNSNLREADESPLWKLAPMAVMGAATLGAGLALTPLQSAMMSVPKIAGQVASGTFNPMSLIPQAIGYGGAALGIDPTILSLAKAGVPYAIQLVQQQMNNGGSSNTMAYNPEQENPMWSGPAPVNTAGGGTDWSNVLQTVLGGATGGAGFGGLNAGSIPAIASAINSYNNSGDYMDMATKYADQMNPFGSQRGYYQDLLKKSYEDPLAFLNDPSHQAIQKRQAAALSAKLAASGYLGSGKMSTDMMNYLAESDAMFLDKERDRLGGFAGSQIGPGAAAGLIQAGITGSVNSKNAALAALTQAFTTPENRRVAGGGGGGGTIPGTGGGSITDLIKNASGPASQAILKIIGSGGTVDPNSELVAAAIREQVPTPGYEDDYNTGNAQDITNQFGGVWDDSGTPFPTIPDYTNDMWDITGDSGGWNPGYDLIFGD